MAAVQGNEEMRMHFRHDVDVRKVMALVRDCMGAAKVQRNVLEVVLGIVLETKYDPAQPAPQIVNADAAPLFFRMLMQVRAFSVFPIWSSSIVRKLETVVLFSGA
jgi:hypothetical protein